MARRGRRPRVSGEPTRLSDVLPSVVETLGGALVADAGEPAPVESVIEPAIAARTTLIYRDGELRVYAATNADATMLRFERSRLASWARDVYGLGVDPRVTVLVGAPRRGA